MAGKNHRKRIRRLEALRVNQPQRFEVLRRQSFASRTFELIEAIEANSTTEFAKILQRVVEQYPHEFEEFKQMALLRICATAAEKLCDLDQLSIVNWRKVLGKSSVTRLWWASPMKWLPGCRKGKCYAVRTTSTSICGRSWSS